MGSNIVKHTESEQSIENYIESLEIKCPEEKQVYTKVIQNLIQEMEEKLKKIDVVLFNHKVEIKLKPIQGI